MHDYDAYCDKPGKLHLPELGYRYIRPSSYISFSPKEHWVLRKCMLCGVIIVGPPPGSTQGPIEGICRLGMMRIIIADPRIEDVRGIINLDSWWYYLWMEVHWWWRERWCHLHAAYETTQKHHLSSVGNKNMMVHIICYHLFHTPSVMRGHRIGW